MLVYWGIAVLGCIATAIFISKKQGDKQRRLEERVKRQERIRQKLNDQKERGEN